MSKYRSSVLRPSGAEWLGDVPPEWAVMSARRVFEAKREAAREGDEQLSATQRYGVVPQREFMEREDQKVMLALSGVGNFKHVERDDFVISLRSFEGGIEHSAFTGCVSPAYTVLRLRSEAEPCYFKYLLKSKPYVAALQSTTDSLRDGKSIKYEQFGSIPIPLPPLPEQTAITAFLNRETGKIDALVEEQKRLIELLKEKRQAVISHAVIKGLDPNVRMKPSQVEWLGDVPAHWVVRPLKYVASFQSGGTPSKANPDFWGGDVPWVSAKDLKAEVLQDSQDHITERAVDDGAAFLLPAGSVVVLVRGMMLARAFPVVQLAVPMAINQDLKAVVRSKLRLGYLAWLFRGLQRECLARTEEASHGTKALRMEAWTSMSIPMPPPDEQAAIERHLLITTSRLDDLSAYANAAIALLQERRAALISAAVTGKIDMREIAAQEKAA